jgi:polyisoprenyl-phosphate glycosyltransferase
MAEIKKTLSLVIAVYFNAESLPALFDEIAALEKELASRGIALELVFVNDGSQDGSLQELLGLKHARPATKIINLSRNFGGIAAAKVGFRFVTGDAFAILAADGQDPPTQILPMVEQWQLGHKFVVATRASREDPFATRAFSWLFYRIVNWFVLTDYPKSGFDLMLLDKAMLPYMVNSTKHTSPAMYAYWLGFKPAVVPYHRRARRHGRSRWTFAKKLRAFADAISGFSVAPIRFMSTVGIVVAILSFVYGIHIVINALLGNMTVRGFATLVVLISFFSGLILMMLGLVGEYLWRVLEAVNNKPEAVIDEMFL